MLQLWILFFIYIKGHYLGFCINIILVSTAQKHRCCCANREKCCNICSPSFMEMQKSTSLTNWCCKCIELIGESLWICSPNLANWRIVHFLSFFLPQMLQSYWMMKCIKKREELIASYSAPPICTAIPDFMGSSDQKHIDTKFNLMTLQ